MTQIDSLVESYLGAVARAAADLPEQRREELLTDLREHITTARAELDPETEADVRTILDRLGDPATITAEARRDLPPRPAPLPTANAYVAPRRSMAWIWVVVALVLVVPVVVCVFGALLFYPAGRSVNPGEPIVQLSVVVVQPSQISPSPS